MAERLSAEQKILLDRAKSREVKYTWRAKDGKEFTATDEDYEAVRKQVLRHMRKTV